MILNNEYFFRNLKRQKSCDRLNTDLNLVRWLYSELSMTARGTWQASMVGFPKELKSFKERMAPSTDIYFEENSGSLRILSYFAGGKLKIRVAKRYLENLNLLLYYATVNNGMA